MRAVLCSAFTGPEDLRIGEIEEPEPASDEILIDVHAASVSFHGPSAGLGPLPDATIDAIRARHGSGRRRHLAQARVMSFSKE